MIRYAFLALACAVSVPAFAYERTELKVTVTRENIRDTGPKVVAELMGTVARYVIDGPCFVLGKQEDIACVSRRERWGNSSYTVLELGATSLLRMLQAELTWKEAAHMNEFYSLLPKGSTATFSAIGGNERMFGITDIVFRSGDGKTTYRIQ